MNRSSPPKNTNRLATKQARVTVLSALIFGLFISTIQIVYDFHEQQAKLLETADQFLQILDQPVSFAAYSKNPELARELVVGFFSYHPVYHAEITLKNGQSLYAETGTLAHGPYRTLSDWLFKPTLKISHNLNYQPAPTDLFGMSQTQQVGTLEIHLDTYFSGKLFLDRSFRAILGSLASAVLLSLTLLAFYNRFLTRPFVAMVAQTEKIDPERPESMRITLPKTHERDEFGLLTNNINRLLGTIETNLEARMERVREAQRLRTEMQEEKKRSDELKAFQKELTTTNNRLAETVHQLESTQEALVESNTLASLGGLVAGVAHELNTPVGVAVTSASFLRSQINRIDLLHQEQKMTEADFSGCLKKSLEITEVLESNLARAAQLITSFKQVAVDQTHFFVEKFDLREYLKTVIASLAPETKGTGLQISLQVPEGIKMRSLPGALAQVVVNLLQNCLKHAFDPQQGGKLVILAGVDEHVATLRFIDDGKGIAPEDLPHIFKPFYTTKKGQGGTGLGLNILYNLISQKLQGRIEVSSQLGQGTEFKVILPLVLPD